MPLLPPELRKQLPPLYSQQQETNPMIYCKFFLPGSQWTWYVTEGSEADGQFLCFGYVFGEFGEWGYFALTELETVRGCLGLAIERDAYFTPARWQEVKAQHEKQFGKSL